MEKFKPNYLGKTLPSENKDQMTKFFDKKYDSFNKIYDACKDSSSDISDIKNISDDNSDDLLIKISASNETINKIKETINSNDSLSCININNDTFCIPKDN